MDPLSARVEGLEELVRSLIEGRLKMHALPDHLSAEEKAAVRRVALERMTGAIQAVQQVIDPAQLLALQAEVAAVYVDPALIEYAHHQKVATQQESTGKQQHAHRVEKQERVEVADHVLVQESVEEEAQQQPRQAWNHADGLDA